MKSLPEFMLTTVYVLNSANMLCTCPASFRLEQWCPNYSPNQQHQHVWRLSEMTICRPYSRPPKSETLEWIPGTSVVRRPPGEKNLMLGKIKGRRRRVWQRMRWLDGITDSWTWVWVNSGSWWWAGSLACCGSWGRKESDMTERLNWTDNQVVLKCVTFV